jgi:hypothetical protein
VNGSVPRELEHLGSDPIDSALKAWRAGHLWGAATGRL